MLQTPAAVKNQISQSKILVEEQRKTGAKENNEEPTGIFPTEKGAKVLDHRKNSLLHRTIAVGKRTKTSTQFPTMSGSEAGTGGTESELEQRSSWSDGALLAGGPN